MRNFLIRKDQICTYTESKHNSGENVATLVGVQHLCAAPSLANCSREAVNSKVPRLRIQIPENKSVIRESPGAHPNIGSIVEEHSFLSERAARQLQRHDGVLCDGIVPDVDEQQFFEKHEHIGSGEFGARDPLETHRE